MIKLHNISKSFDDKVILENASLELKENRVSVLVGRSGEGKSTLFRLIMGLEELDQGDIQIDEKTRVGMVFQNYELYPHLSVLNNLNLPQRVANKVNKEEATKNSIQILRQLNIEYLLDKTIGTLSGGESQRLAIARALVMKNNVLLLDEPTSALDQENIDKLIDLLKELSTNTTLFIITHDLCFASKVGDYIYKISENKVVEYSLN